MLTKKLIFEFKNDYILINIAMLSDFEIIKIL